MVRVRDKALLVCVDAVRLAVAANEVYVLSAPKRGRLQHAAAATTDNAFIRDLLFRLRAPPAALLGASWCVRSLDLQLCVLCAGTSPVSGDQPDPQTCSGIRTMRLWTAACPLSCAHWRERWRQWLGCWVKRLPYWKLMPCLPLTGWQNAYAARSLMPSAHLSQTEVGETQDRRAPLPCQVQGQRQKVLYSRQGCGPKAAFGCWHAC